MTLGAPTGVDVDALKARGAVPMVHDPMYSDDEIERLGFAPFHLGEAADAAVVQADHAEYRDLAPADLPGVKAIIDGRRVSSVDRWPGIAYRVIGKAVAAAS